MEAGAGAEEPRGYGGAAAAGAVLATVFFPLIALIVALLLLGSQQDPDKKSALRMWAFGSAAWIVVGTVVVWLAFFGGSHSTGGVDPAGPCVGGPKLGADGKDVSGDGTRFAVPCAISGTETITLPNQSP